MTDAHRPRMAELLEDWVTIWHSELAALVIDPEMQEALQRSIDLWAAQARAVARAAGSALDAAGPPPPPGPPAPGPAADGRDALIAGLLERVAELEQRLARLERG